MNTYLVSVMPEDVNERRRVVLDRDSHGDVVQQIKVNSSGRADIDYEEARSMVDETGFYHDPNHGWFLS